jgi:mannose/fructose/N-acetylgalactosamine-specific phosphotransferase system component IIC
LPWRHRLTSEFANLATDCFAASALQEGDPITPGTVLLVTAEVFNRHHLFVITFVGLTRWHGFAAEFASLRRDLIASLALHQFGTVTPVTIVQSITESLGLGVFAGSRAVAAGTAVVTLLGVALVAAAAVDKPAPIAPVAIRFAVAEATGITLVRLARGH